MKSMPLVTNDNFRRAPRRLKPVRPNNRVAMKLAKDFATCGNERLFGKASSQAVKKANLVFS